MTKRDGFFWLFKAGALRILRRRLEPTTSEVCASTGSACRAYDERMSRRNKTIGATAEPSSTHGVSHVIKLIAFGNLQTELFDYAHFDRLSAPQYAPQGSISGDEAIENLSSHSQIERKALIYKALRPFQIFPQKI